MNDSQPTPAMIEAGRAALRAAFGGETEGNNRAVDFQETATAVWQAMQAAQPPLSEEALIRGASSLGTSLGVFVNLDDYRDSVTVALEAR